VADCLVKVVSSPTTAYSNQIYTLTGPQALSFANAANIIGLQRGKPVGYISPPAWLARIVLPKAAGMPKWLAMEVIDLLQAISKGAQAPTTQDVEKLLGRPPRGFEAFAKEQVSAFI
jgi:uncharacterized protein YbjT (DUF2867 family)